MTLDTLPFMNAAMKLYTSLGFSPCPAYDDTLLKETVFMELRL